MPKQLKPDLSNWALADAFTVYQAACLWVGVDPSKELTDISQHELSQLTPILELLKAAAKEGTISVDSSNNLFLDHGDYSNGGDYSKSRVTRNDLKAFAEAKGKQPAFLFDASQTKTGAEEGLSIGNGNPDKRGVGRPPTCPRELWLERFAILSLQGKVSLDDSQDSIAAALSEDLAKLGFKVKAATITKDWIGPIIRKTRDVNE